MTNDNNESSLLKNLDAQIGGEVVFSDNPPAGSIYRLIRGIILAPLVIIFLNAMADEVVELMKKRNEMEKQEQLALYKDEALMSLSALPADVRKRATDRLDRSFGTLEAAPKE